MNWRPVGAFVASVVLVATAAGWGPAGAQSQPADPQDKIDSLKEHIQEASAEEARLLEQMEQAEQRKGALDAKVGELDRQIKAVQQDVAAAQGQLSVIETTQRSTEARLEETRRQLQAAKDQLGRQAISAYTGQTEAAQWAELLLESKSIGDLAAKRTYLRAAAGSQAETIATATRLKDQVEDLRNQLDVARRKAQAQRDVVAAQQDKLETSRQTQDGARQELAAQVSDLDETRDEILSRKEEFEAEVRALERDSAAVAATLRQRQSSTGSASTDTADERAAPSGGNSGGSSGRGSGGPGGGSGGGSGGGQSPSPARRSGLVSPIPGAPVVSGFGQRVHPVYGTVRMHTGVDLGASTGTAIRAAGDGVVVTAASMGGYGLATVIDHGGGLATLYGHQSSIGVSEGQRVSQGQVIGRVGCTGTCTGPHLHYEVRINGSPVNPASYL